MDEKLYKILKKVYCKVRYVKDESGRQVRVETGDEFDCVTRTVQYSTDNLSQQELFYLQESGYPTNEIVHDTHDSAIEKLKKILQHENISLQNLIAAYICGFFSFPRGRQPIISYLFATAVSYHTYTNAYNNHICETCGMEDEFWVERGNEIFGRYAGQAWNERRRTFYVDLEEFSRLSPKAPTQEDLRIFFAVIDLIRTSSSDETVSKLEKRILKAKLIPHCNKYVLRGMLMTLAELGVMPNRFIKPLYDGFTEFNKMCEIDRKVPGSARSDIVLPLSGWRGECGICEERFSEIFGEFAI